MSPAGNERPIFLVGFMACGKTTVARYLSRSLGWDLVDTDREVERREGRPVARIFAERGEAHFRHVEREILTSLGELRRAVVATGGGLFLAHAPRRWMIARGHTVWLDTPLSDLRRRVAGTAGALRPMWDSDDPVALRALFEQRRAAYALAELRIDARRMHSERVARLILRWLRGPRGQNIP